VQIERRRKPVSKTFRKTLDRTGEGTKINIEEQKSFPKREKEFLKGGSGAREQLSRRETEGKQTALY